MPRSRCANSHSSGHLVPLCPIDDFFSRITDIKENTETISTKIENVKKRHQTINAAVSIQEEEKGKQELEQEQEIIKRLANNIRSRLKKMQQEVEEEDKSHNEDLEKQGLLGTEDEKSVEILGFWGR